MDKEKVYEYIEEADKREVMEILNTAVNRFRELYADQELIIMTLPAGDPEKRRLCLDRMLELLQNMSAEPYDESEKITKLA